MDSHGTDVGKEILVTVDGKKATSSSNLIFVVMRFDEHKHKKINGFG